MTRIGCRSPALGVVHIDEEALDGALAAQGGLGEPCAVVGAPHALAEGNNEEARQQVENSPITCPRLRKPIAPRGSTNKVIAGEVAQHHAPERVAVAAQPDRRPAQGESPP